MSSLGLRRGKDGHTATDGLTKSGQEPTHRHCICEVTPQALLSAVPSAQPGVTQARVLLSGDVPSPIHPPAGCRFHTRCPKAMRQCKTEEPRWQEVGGGHYTACHLYA